MPDKTKILVADDHGVVRAGLRALINTQPDLEVCGEAADGAQAVEEAARLGPDLVLLDLRMPRLGGLEAIAQIRRLQPKARILILTMHDDEAYLRSALLEGASGYVLKRAIDVELLTAIRAIAKGGTYIDPALGSAVVAGFLASGGGGEARSVQVAPSPDAGGLSRREREVLALLAAGHTNREIADHLVVSVKTVEGYRARIVDKIGVRGRAALTRYAVEHGIRPADAPADR